MTNDNEISGVPFDSEDPSEEQLWSELPQLDCEVPSARLRSAFYRNLERFDAPSWSSRARQWLGFSNNVGWVTAAACLALGIAMGQRLLDAPETSQTMLTALEHQVAMLNRSLILDRLENASANKRLRGVIDAVGIVEHDAEIAHALLTRAVEDRVYSVRSAAIDALGPQLSKPELGDELITLLEAADSPLVQFSLVDLVLRFGSVEQLKYLLHLADEGRLHPELVRHVKDSIRRNRV